MTTDEAAISRLWSKFVSANEDLAKVPELCGAAAQAAIQDAVDQGHDVTGYILNDEDEFLADVARRVRERASELGIRNVRQQSEHAELYEATRRAVAGSTMGTHRDADAQKH